MTQLPRHTRLARPLNSADPRLLVRFSGVASVITIYGKITSCRLFYVSFWKSSDLSKCGMKKLRQARFKIDSCAMSRIDRARTVADRPQFCTHNRASRLTRLTEELLIGAACCEKNFETKPRLNHELRLNHTVASFPRFRVSHRAMPDHFAKRGNGAPGAQRKRGESCVVTLLLRV